MNKITPFGKLPFSITMPPPTDEEAAALDADDIEALKLFVNQNLQPSQHAINLPMALLIAPVPAILLLLGALALGWRP